MPLQTSISKRFAAHSCFHLHDITVTESIFWNVIGTSETRKAMPNLPILKIYPMVDIPDRHCCLSMIGMSSMTGHGRLNNRTSTVLRLLRHAWTHRHTKLITRFTTAVGRTSGE